MSSYRFSKKRLVYLLVMLALCLFSFVYGLTHTWIRFISGAYGVLTLLAIYDNLHPYDDSNEGKL